MKKVFFSILASTLLSTSFAQNHIGFKIGANAALVNKFDLIENITPNLKPAPALGGGLFLEHSFNKSISLVTEANFVQKGFKVSEGFTIPKEDIGIDIPLKASVKMRLQYLQLPVLLKIKNERGTYISFGPSVGYLSNTGLRVNVLNIFPVKTSFPKSVYKEFEVSGMVNIGTEQKLTSKLSLLVEGRYEHSLSRLINTPVIEIPVRSQNFGMNVGLKIKI